MKQYSKILKLPILEDFYDYKKSVHLTIIAVYILILLLVTTLSPNPMRMAFFVTTPMLFAKLLLFRKVLLNDITIFIKHLKRYIPFVLVGGVLTVALNVLGGIISSLLGADNAPNQVAAELAFWQTPFLGFFALVIVAPIAEELVFRRSIKVMVKNKIFYYFLSALLFGVAHIFIDFTFPYSFAFIFPYIFAGLGYMFIYDKSNNIWCPILAHLLSNALGVIILLLS